MIKITKNLKIFLLNSIGMLLCLYHSTIFAGTAESLATISKRVQGNVLTIVKLLIVLSYCAGVGFAMAGVLGFKAHKDNPQQTPLSKPMVYLAVAAFLLFLPSLMGTTGATIFGGNASSGPAGDILNISNVQEAQN